MKFQLWVVLFVATFVYAQGSVTIFGTVTDASGAAIPGVAVTAVNAETGAIRRSVSDPSGGYVIAQLPIGSYSVRAEAAGFKSFVQERIAVQVDENRRVNLTLEVGAVSESVTVTAEAAQVETRSGALREVVDSRRIVELPLNGRNALQLQYLVAGAGGRTTAGQEQNDSVSINGSRANSNNYTLDNGDNHDPYFNTPSVFPNPDALEEFSLQTNAYGADKGRNAGAVMNAVTRSGTNSLHGSLFEFLRNEKLNARNFFANNVPPFKRNQFGGTVGGPIRKDKTFYFASYQRTSERSAPGSITPTVLTPAQRTGDFSALNKPVKDPLGGNFPNGIIPASRLNKASLNFLNAFVPLPNRPQGLYTFSSQQKVDDDQVIAKIDHNLTAANQISGRFLFSYNDLNQSTNNITLPGFLAGIKYADWNTAITDTHIFRATLVNVFTFGFIDIQRKQIPVVPGNKSWTDFGAGFTRAFAGDAPVGHDTQVDGYFQAQSRFPLNHFRKSFQFSDGLNWTRGAHLLKFGGDVRRSILDLQELFQGDPMVRFRATYTGDAAADFLLGRPTIITQIAEDKNQPRTTEMDLYIQDDWKVSQRLTLNLGLRWDPFFPFSEVGNKFGQVRLGQQSTVFPTAPAGIVFPGDAGVPRSTVRNRLSNLGPRIGFAFDPFASGKTSIRGGYGIFYSEIRQQANNQISNNQPFSIRLAINNPTGGLDNPYAESGNPFPFAAPATPEARRGYKFLTPLTVAEWDPDFRNALAQQWNFNIQQQFLGSYVVTAAYVGSKGNHLFIQNELNPAIFNGTSRPADQRRLLYPTFASITDYQSAGNSTYHAFQVTLNKRLAHGVTILTNYTWSKLLDNGSGDGAAPANPFNLRAEKALSNADITHRFVASYIWQLPALAGKPWILRHTLGGWETNGIITLESGRPFTVTSGSDISGSAVNADRPDLAGSPFLDAGRPHGELIQQYFNRAAFVANAPGTFGNVGRNILRGPGQANVDFGVIKAFPVTERQRVQFRGEVFNALNRVNFGQPNASLSAPTFGKITSAGSPRVMQLALKYIF